MVSLAGHVLPADQDPDMSRVYPDVPWLHVPIECACYVAAHACGNAIEEHQVIPLAYPDFRSAQAIMPSHWTGSALNLFVVWYQIITWTNATLLSIDLWTIFLWNFNETEEFLSRKCNENGLKMVAILSQPQLVNKLWKVIQQGESSATLITNRDWD